MLIFTIEPVSGYSVSHLLASPRAMGAIFIALLGIFGGYQAVSSRSTCRNVPGTGRPILANSGITRPIHDLLYTYTGQRLRGAIIIFAVTVVAIVIRDHYRRRIESTFDRLAPSTKRYIRWGLLAIAVILAVLFPLYAGNFVGQVLLMVGLFILMGMGLNLEVGIAGLLDLGFVAFYAVGAYTTALLTADSPFALAHLSYWEAMPISVLASVIVGIFRHSILKVQGDLSGDRRAGSVGSSGHVLYRRRRPLLAGIKAFCRSRGRRSVIFLYSPAALLSHARFVDRCRVPLRFRSRGLVAHGWRPGR